MEKLEKGDRNISSSQVIILVVVLYLDIEVQ